MVKPAGMIAWLILAAAIAAPASPRAAARVEARVVIVRAEKIDLSHLPRRGADHDRPAHQIGERSGAPQIDFY